MTGCGCRRPSSGTWTARWSTPSPTGSRRSTSSPRSTAAPGAEEHALNLVGNDLLSRGRYIREHMGIDLTPEEIVEELLDGVVARVRAPSRGDRARASCWRSSRARRALRPGHDVLRRFVAPILEQLPPETFDVVVTGDRVERGKPHPEPYLTAAAAAGRRAGGLPGDRGLQHRRQVGRGGRLHGARACPNHVPVLEGERRVFATSLAAWRRGPGRRQLAASTYLCGRGAPEVGVATAQRQRRGSAAELGAEVPGRSTSRTAATRCGRQSPVSSAPLDRVARSPRPCARWRAGPARRARSAGSRRCRGRPAAASPGPPRGCAR